MDHNADLNYRRKIHPLKGLANIWISVKFDSYQKKADETVDSEMEMVMCIKELSI